MRPPPITAERSQRIAAADFRPPDNATAFQVANGVNEMQEPNGGTLVATFRPAAGDVMTSVEINIDPDGQPGSFTLAREEATGTVTPLVTAPIPATSGFTTISANIPIGPFAEADPNTTAYVLTVNLEQNAKLRGATIFAFGQAGSLVLIPPQRVLDTRLPVQGPKVASGTLRTFTVDTIVPRIAVGVLLNVTLDETAGAGFLTVFAPDDVDAPVAPPISNVNWYTNNQIVANLAVSGLVGEADVYFKTGGPGSTHVIIDVIGYFA